MKAVKRARFAREWCGTVETNSREVGRSGYNTQLFTPQIEQNNIEVAANPTIDGETEDREGRKVRRVGKKTVCGGLKRAGEARKRVLGGAKNHRQEGLRARGMRREAAGTATGFAVGAGILWRKDSGRAGRSRGEAFGAGASGVHFSCFFAFALLQFSFGFDILKR